MIHHNLPAILAAQRAAAEADMNPPEAVRRARLERLLALVRNSQVAIEDALNADFGVRARDETLAFEVFTSVEDIRHTLKHLHGWMQPQPRAVAVLSLPGHARVVPQPLGVVGIIVPWNYPLYLAIGPLSGALAAGNRAMVKFSPDTPQFAALFAKLVAREFAPEELAVVEDEGPAFSALPFDHLFFTGSTRTGKLVMRAAAENLTPVTLELGGKSPAIVTKNFPLEKAALNIMFGKTANAGQTCVAPDYVMVPQGQEPAFIAAAKTAVARFYPTLQGNPDYTAVINDRQLARLKAHLADARQKGAALHQLHEDGAQQGSRQMAPVALTGVTDAMTVMQEEIFGPLLPVIGYESLAGAVSAIKARPRPLALYLFSNDKAEQDAVVQGSISGGVGINAVMMHVSQNNLPFGGVGPSGTGHYHGREGFETFSKMKPVFYQSRFNALSVLYPPRVNGRLRWLMSRLAGGAGHAGK